MTNITVKNVPPDLYERLKEVAQTHRRSINSEVIACIERAVGAQPTDVEQLIARARQIRELTVGYAVGDQELTQAKAAGRP